MTEKSPWSRSSPHSLKGASKFHSGSFFSLQLSAGMSVQQLQHRRTHNLLLISKLLNGRDNASPFTLVVDSLEQSGRPLVREIIKRARVCFAQAS